MDSEKGKDNGEKKKGNGIFSSLRRRFSKKKPKKAVVEDEVMPQMPQPAGNGIFSSLRRTLSKKKHKKAVVEDEVMPQHAEFSCHPTEVSGILCENDKPNRTKGDVRFQPTLLPLANDSKTILPTSDSKNLAATVTKEEKSDSEKEEPEEQTSQSASSSSDKSETTITPPSTETRQLSSPTSQDNSSTTESQSLDLSVDASCIPPESIRSERSEGTSRNKDSFGVASVVGNREETRTCTEPKPDTLEPIDTRVWNITGKNVQIGDGSMMNVHHRGVSDIPIPERRRTNTDKLEHVDTRVRNITGVNVQLGDGTLINEDPHRCVSNISIPERRRTSTDKLEHVDPRVQDITGIHVQIGVGTLINEEPHRCVSTGTEVDDDTHASNRCDEFLKKNDKNVLTAAELKAMNEVIKSVGCIHFTGTSGDCHGTAFLVGSSHYIFTAWHIVRDIISVNEIGAAHGHNLRKLTKPDVYMDFGDNKCLLKPTVIYHNEELDVALLQLQENTEDGNKIWFPSSLRQFNKFENITEITILGYGHPDSSKGAVADNKCEVINERSTKSQQAIKWFNSEGKNTVKQLLQQSNELCMLQDLLSPYDLINNPKYIVCNSFVTKGGSGSPMVTMSGEVVGLYTRGIPAFYWKIKEDLRSEIPVKFVFGCGARFDAIYKSMQEFQQHEPESLTAEIMKDIFHSP